MSERTISHYRILEPLGRGGMGVIVKAEDLRLGRLVALKLLPEELVKDPVARERLTREARAASSLNHPNICTIYEIGDDGHEHFIAMELLEGRTLAQTLNGRPLDSEPLFTLAIQIASGLEAAHAKGLVHRDIKPGNIFVLPRGDAKILDFGLATLSHGHDDPERDATVAVLTTPGAVMGTQAYMAPEQLRGEKADARTDVYAFGLVLYEMATGHRAYDEPTPALLHHAILGRDPAPPSSLAPDLPAPLEPIIMRALERDPDLRYQSAADLVADLRRAHRGISPTQPFTAAGAATSRVAAASRPRAWRTQALVAALAVAVAVLAWQRFGRTTSTPTLAAEPFQQVTDGPGAETFPTLSPDGKTVAYVVTLPEGEAIFTKRVGGQTPTRLAEGTQPAFSPDGERLAFRSERDGGGIFVMGSTGESIRRVADFGYNPAWSPDGRAILVSTTGIANPIVRRAGGRIWRVDLSSGEKTAITPENVDAVQPQWSPGGQRIGYWSVGPGGRSSIWTITADGRDPVRAVDDTAVNWNPVWAPDGRTLYFLSNAGGTMNVWFAGIDERTGQIRTPPRALSTSPADMSQVSIAQSGRQIAYTDQFTMSNLQALVFDEHGQLATLAPRQVTRMSKGALGIDASADDQWIAFAAARQHEDLYLMRTDGTALRQVTDGSFGTRLPSLSPDGKRIVFSSDRFGTMSIWAINADGSGLVEITQGEKGRLLAPVWTPDSARVVYANVGAGIFMRDAASPAAPPRRLPVKLGADEVALPRSWSPDGRTLGLSLLRRDSTFAGVMLFTPATGETKRISDVGAGPLWLADGVHIVFSDQLTGRVFVADTRTGERQVVYTSPLSRIDGAAIGGDRRTLYLVLSALESDVWVLNLK